MSRPNLGVIAIVLTMWGAPSLHGAAHDTERRPDNVVLLWNDAALKAVRNTRFGPTMAARALAITHTCMYDAWTAYDRSARATTGRSSPKRPAHERTRANRETAVSYAAYRALVDLFPSEEPLFTALMALRGFSVGDASGDPSTATRVGNQACAAVLESRRHDGLNQRGELNGGSPYLGLHGLRAGQYPGPAGRPKSVATASKRKRRHTVLPHAALGQGDAVRASDARPVSSASTVDVSRTPIPRSGGRGSRVEREPRRSREGHRGGTGRTVRPRRRRPATGLCSHNTSRAGTGTISTPTCGCSSSCPTRCSMRASRSGTANGSSTPSGRSVLSGSYSRDSRSSRGPGPTRGRGCSLANVSAATLPLHRSRSMCPVTARSAPQRRPCCDASPITVTLRGPPHIQGGHVDHRAWGDAHSRRDAALENVRRGRRPGRSLTPDTAASTSETET